MLPSSLTIPLCYSPTADPLHRGGLADIWKGQYRGRGVAAKVLRGHGDADVEWVKRVGCPPFVVCIGGLTASRAEIL
jgi:hypothetical protein